MRLVTKRPAAYSAYLPKAARWQAELLADDFGGRDEARAAMSALGSLQRVANRLDQLTAPESIDEATSSAAALLRAARIEATHSLDKMKADVFTYITGEREAAFAGVDAQRTAALADIDRQRILTLDQMDDLRRQTFADMNDLRRHTFADMTELTNRTIGKLAFTVALLLLLAALLAILVFKTVSAHPPADLRGSAAGPARAH